MVIYQVNLAVDPAVAEAWEAWMLQTHIPEVMATEAYHRYHFRRCIDVAHPEADGWQRYTVDYVAHSYGQVQTYLDQHAARLRAAVPTRFQDRFRAQRTLLEAAQSVQL